MGSEWSKATSASGTKETARLALAYDCFRPETGPAADALGGRLVTLSKRAVLPSSTPWRSKRPNRDETLDRFVLYIGWPRRLHGHFEAHHLPTQNRKATPTIGPCWLILKL
jgi:hypothetical protein